MIPSLDAVSAGVRLAVLNGADPVEAPVRLAFLAEVVTAAGVDWSIFESREGEVLAGLVLRALGRLPADRVGRRLGALRVEAASRVRAMTAAARGVRVGSGEVAAGVPEPSHAGFFGLDLWRLQHRRFDGQMSPTLVREVFVMGDAVTVLPYDPVRDRVLLIEQMRMGPLGRGDPLPWQLEAIAGRIDPGESPEEAARREAVEEALGLLELGRARVAERRDDGTVAQMALGALLKIEIQLKDGTPVLGAVGRVVQRREEPADPDHAGVAIAESLRRGQERRTGA